MLVLKCGSVVWQRHSLGHAQPYVALATQVFGIRHQAKETAGAAAKATAAAAAAVTAAAAAGGEMG